MDRELQYKVMAVDDTGMIELWDQKSIIDPDLPRHKSTETYRIPGHTFQVGDLVSMHLYLDHRAGLHCDPTKSCVECRRKVND